MNTHHVTLVSFLILLGIMALAFPSMAYAAPSPKASGRPTMALAPTGDACLDSCQARVSGAYLACGEVTQCQAYETLRFDQCARRCAR
jgi:hypothetical protein